MTISPQTASARGRLVGPGRLQRFRRPFLVDPRTFALRPRTGGSGGRRSDWVAGTPPSPPCACPCVGWAAAVLAAGLPSRGSWPCAVGAAAGRHATARVAAAAACTTAGGDRRVRHGTVAPWTADRGRRSDRRAAGAPIRTNRRCHRGANPPVSAFSPPLHTYPLLALSAPTTRHLPASVSALPFESPSPFFPPSSPPAPSDAPHRVGYLPPSPPSFLDAADAAATPATWHHGLGSGDWD